MKEVFKGLNIGDKVTLVKISKEITDRNPRLKLGDTGTIIMFHEHEYCKGHPQITILWDRAGIGDTRDMGGKYLSNCWTVSLMGLSLNNYEGYNPLTWKIKTMWERQPYMQKQVGVGK